LVCTAAQAQDTHDKLTGMAALLSLISALDAQQRHMVCWDSGASRKMRDSLRAGLAYIQEHYREKCTLNEIAAHAGRSPIYFHDVFQQVMGVTPYEYIAQLRLAEAKRRLTMTDEDPVDIAQSCGFCSQSYFNFVFKKAMGMTPLNYRRRAAAKYLENNE
jgi:AraC-like DNA-binding protein